MTSKERVQATLSHKQPDKVVVDFGSHYCSGMHVDVIRRLRDYYGLEKKPVTAWEMFLMTGEIDEDLRQVLGIDIYPAMGPGTTFGVPRYPTKPWTTLQGQEIMVPATFETKPDGKGGLYTYPCGDTSVPPSGHMPQNGLYFDLLSRDTGFDEDDMHAEDNLQEFPYLSDSDVEFIAQRADEDCKAGKGVMLDMPGVGFGDAGVLPGGGLRHPKGIRDIAEWYMAPLLYPDYVYEVFEKQVDIAIENMKKINAACGDKIDAMAGCATDFAHQNGIMMSAGTFREIYLPNYKRLNDWVHQNTNWKVMKHSCGAVRELIPLLIEAGFDCLNPVQISAPGMEPEGLKADFGKDMVFWGGGVDTQQVLPKGTPEDVRRQVLKNCEIFGKDGGFIFNAVHNVQADVPTENLVAMFDAVKEFNGDK